jgi:hypothetical protein
MQIARTQNEKSVADIVARVYNLKAGDPRAAAAAQTLLAANPQLNNLTQLPAGTPVVVPPIAGVGVADSSIADPQRAAWMNVLNQLVTSAQQASNAQTTGVATTAPATADARRTLALTTLGNDIANFIKRHTS